MSRKDYLLIAAKLRAEFEYIQQYGTHENRVGFTRAISAITTALEADNPRFDSERFEEACVGA